MTTVGGGVLAGRNRNKRKKEKAAAAKVVRDAYAATAAAAAAAAAAAVAVAVAAGTEAITHASGEDGHTSMDKGKQKQKAWVVHPGAPGPETRKAIRTAIRQAMTRQAMIAECFHKAQSEITDSGSTIKPEYIDDGAISSADPQVVPTSSPFNDFNSEYYATIAAAAFHC